LKHGGGTNLDVRRVPEQETLRVVAVARRREGDEGSASDCRRAVDWTKFTKCCDVKACVVRAMRLAHHTCTQSKEEPRCERTFCKAFEGDSSRDVYAVQCTHALGRSKQRHRVKHASHRKLLSSVQLHKNSCDGEHWLRKVRVPRDTQAVSHHGQIRNKAHCAPTILTQQPGRSRHPCLHLEKT
jgi:hypothetical protein